MKKSAFSMADKEFGTKSFRASDSFSSDICFWGDTQNKGPMFFLIFFALQTAVISFIYFFQSPEGPQWVSLTVHFLGAFNHKVRNSQRCFTFNSSFICLPSDSKAANGYLQHELSLPLTKVI